jgi:hypothetical protein
MRENKRNKQSKKQCSLSQLFLVNDDKYAGFEDCCNFKKYYTRKPTTTTMCVCARFSIRRLPSMR